MDKLIDTIDSLVSTTRSHVRRTAEVEKKQSSTSWTDVLIFIALGVAAIFILDMFFKFGKWIVENNISKMQQPPRPSFVPQMMPPQYYNYQAPPGAAPPVGMPYYANNPSIPTPSI